MKMFDYLFFIFCVFFSVSTKVSTEECANYRYVVFYFTLLLFHVSLSDQSFEQSIFSISSQRAS